MQKELDRQNDELEKSAKQIKQLNNKARDSKEVQEDMEI